MGIFAFISVLCEVSIRRRATCPQPFRGGGRCARERLTAKYNFASISDVSATMAVRCEDRNIVSRLRGHGASRPFGL